MDIFMVVLQSAVLHLSFGLSGRTCDINGKKACCYNHEEANGLCLPCKSGSVAKDGSSCTTCSSNSYGFKCTGRCHCKQNERCDPVEGCILWIASTPSTQEEQTNKPSTDRGQTSKATLSSKGWNKNEIIGPVTENFVTKKSETENELSMRDWIVYLLCIGTVILLIGVSHVVRKYRKLKCRIQEKARDGVEIQNANGVEEDSYNIYDEIDDNHVTETTVSIVNLSILPNTHYLETREQNALDTDQFGSESGDNDGYLHPCNSLQGSFKIDNHSLHESSSERSSDSDFQFDRSSNTDYINPYHTLNNNNRQTSIHNYETSVTVHVVDS